MNRAQRETLQWGGVMLGWKAIPALLHPVRRDPPPLGYASAFLAALWIAGLIGIARTASLRASPPTRRLVTLWWHACAALGLASLITWHLSFNGTAQALQCGAFASLIAGTFVTAGQLDDQSAIRPSRVRLAGTIYLGVVLIVLWQLARQLALR